MHCEEDYQQLPRTHVKVNVEANALALYLKPIPITLSNCKHIFKNWKLWVQKSITVSTTICPRFLWNYVTKRVNKTCNKLCSMYVCTKTWLLLKYNLKIHDTF